MRLLSVLFATAMAVSAQSTLTTTFANNNNGSIGGAIYFDLSAAAGSGGVVVLDFDLNFGQTAGTAGTLELWVHPTTSFGNQAVGYPPPAPWTLYDTMTVAAAGGIGNPSLCTFDTTPLVIADGTTIGCAVAAFGFSHTYTNGTAPLSVYTECALTLTAGTASNAPFTPTIFTPRIPNTNIRFGSGALCATVVSQGPGCGAAVPLTLAASSGPAIQGAVTAPVVCTTSNIPGTALFHLGFVGLSRPGISLGPLGAPANCVLNASLDLIVDVTVLPAASVTWTALTLPPIPPSFVGIEFNAQAAGFDAGILNANTATSNGLKYLIGDN